MKSVGKKWSSYLLDKEESVPGFVDDLAEQGFVILDDFISPDEVKLLTQELLQRLDQGLFKRAGIGTDADYQVDKTVRGDQICWLNEQQPAPALQPFIASIERLIFILNRYCYLGLRDFESHFAVYPAGTFYERHLDQFYHNDNREISVILYLNEDWTEEDGGHLKLFMPNGDEKEVDPIAGRLVIFRSGDLEHEVCLTHKQRYSITGWLLKTPKELSFLR